MKNLEHTGSSKFALVNVVMQRAHELNRGAPPRVPVDSFDKHVATALREAQAGEIELAPPRPRA